MTKKINKYVMGIILWIIFGALVGWVASLIMKTGGGFVQDVIVGIVGSLIGGFIMSFLGQGGVRGFNLHGFIVAVLGACLLIVIVRRVKHV